MILRPLPTYYISHGGGPWPWMMERGERRFAQLAQSLRDLRGEIGSGVKAVLVVSGHWEGPTFLVSASSRPVMEFDYYGFPDWAYQIRYDAPGSPQLATRVAELLQSGGLPAALDPARGFDHGTFSLMKPIYPEGDVPIVQLSVRSDYDQAAHYRAGQLLAPLRDEGVLIVGSGSSFHNMRALMGGGGQAESRVFDHWMTTTLLDNTGDEREAKLNAWEAAPQARFAHPREDHLLPLFVAAGAAHAESADRVYHEDAFMGNAAMSSFRFGPAPIDASGTG